MAKFKLKAKANAGGAGFPIKKGMEVIVDSGSRTEPMATQVINAFNEQHGLSLSSSTSINFGNYEMNKV